LVGRDGQFQVALLQYFLDASRLNDKPAELWDLVASDPMKKAPPVVQYPGAKIVPANSWNVSPGDLVNQGMAFGVSQLEARVSPLLFGRTNEVGVVRTTAASMRITVSWSTRRPGDTNWGPVQEEVTRPFYPANLFRGESVPGLNYIPYVADLVKFTYVLPPKLLEASAAGLEIAVKTTFSPARGGTPSAANPPSVVMAQHITADSTANVGFPPFVMRTGRSGRTVQVPGAGEAVEIGLRVWGVPGTTVQVTARGMLGERVPLGEAVLDKPVTGLVVMAPPELLMVEVSEKEPSLLNPRLDIGAISLIRALRESLLR
jgi:hypothetical protein